MPAPTPNGFYSFLPYLRQGLATKQPTPDTYQDLSSPGGAARGQFGLALTIEKTDANTAQVVSAQVTNTVLLKGPADIIGINSNAIVRTFPSDWVTNFEPNYLPYIEFYDEDFLWRYTPATNRNDGATGEFKFRLRPWITLVVLKEDEFTDVVPFNGILPAISVADPLATFPKANDLWAWGHVHVNGNLSPDGNDAIVRDTAHMNAALANLKTLLDKDPDKSVSRLISSRKLEPNTGYHAFVIPTFENGRRSGLGITGMVSKLTPAWDDQLSSETQFPVYKRWYFKTGGAGDFESLVRLLQPRILDNSVGKRQTDLTHSNNPELEAVTPPVSTLGLQSVIQPTDAEADTWSLNNVYAKKIKDIVNAPAVILDEEGGDPVIAPPLYGCWHAAQNTVATPGGAATWIQEANLDPRFRLFAGAGTEVLRRNQDKYMAIAWEQVGEVIKANKKIRLMQLAKRANVALHKKHLKTLNDELLLNISGPVHERVLGTTTSKTIYKNISESAIPNAMLSAAFRRLTRPGGPLVSNVNITTGSQVSTTELIADVNSGAVQPTQPVQAPPGQISYTVWSQAQLTPAFTSSLQTNSGFVISNPGIYNGTPMPGPNTPQTQILVTSLTNLHALITALPGYSFNTLPSLQLPTTSSVILQRTDPVTNSLAFLKRSVSVKSVNNAVSTIEDLDVVLAAPKIRKAMLTELAALSPDWIMPGLNDVGNNTISLLKANQKYVEAFMLGLNHAMAGELLWRGYPTDQRGTTFSYFWGYNNSMAALQTVPGNDSVANLGNYRDIEDIHLWKTTGGLKALGKNTARTGMNSPDMLVLVIRGELLRKYPGSIIYMQAAEWEDDGSGNPDTTKPRTTATGSSPKYPVFTGNVGEDIYLLGFADITVEEARGGGLEDTSQPGYFVIFQERAGNLKFGADLNGRDNPLPVDPNHTIDKWDDVSWGLLVDDPDDQKGYININNEFAVNENPDNVTWNENAASVAYALLQQPVKLRACLKKQIKSTSIVS